MTRLLRIFFRSLAALSLLLFLATITLWIRSYWLSDKWHWSRHADEISDDYIGKVGWFDAWTFRGRLGILIETNSAYRDDYPHELTHQSESLEFAEPVEVEGPSGFAAVFTGDDKPLYRIYFDHLGFAYYRRDINWTGHNHHFIVPIWSLAAITAIAPFFAIWPIVRRTLRERRQRRRKARGLCLACGYDLRASSGRCPECGAVTELQKPASNPA